MQGQALGRDSGCPRGTACSRLWVCRACPLTVLLAQVTLSLLDFTFDSNFSTLSKGKHCFWVVLGLFWGLLAHYGLQMLIKIWDSTGKRMSLPEPGQPVRQHVRSVGHFVQGLTSAHCFASCPLALSWFRSQLWRYKPSGA